MPGRHSSHQASHAPRAAQRAQTAPTGRVQRSNKGRVHGRGRSVRGGPPRTPAGSQICPAATPPAASGSARRCAPAPCCAGTARRSRQGHAAGAFGHTQRCRSAGGSPPALIVSLAQARGARRWAGSRTCCGARRRRAAGAPPWPARASPAASARPSAPPPPARKKTTPTCGVSAAAPPPAGAPRTSSASGDGIDSQPTRM